MPQSFHVLRCFKCFTFQVDIVKKSRKWNCKLCGDKQSIKKVFCTGTGSECRSAVQELNLQRSMIARQSQQAALEELNRPRDNFNHSGNQESHHGQHSAGDDQDWVEAQPQPFQHWGGSSLRTTWEDPSASRWEAFLPTKPASQVQPREAFSSQVQYSEHFLPTGPSNQVQSREDFLPTGPSNQVQSREAFIQKVQSGQAFLPPKPSSQVKCGGFMSLESFSQVNSNFVKRTSNKLSQVFSNLPDDSSGLVKRQKFSGQPIQISAVSSDRSASQETFSNLSDSTKKLLQFNNEPPQRQVLLPSHEKSILVNSELSKSSSKTQHPNPMNNDFTSRFFNPIQSGSLSSNLIPPSSQSLSQRPPPTSTPDSCVLSQDFAPNVSPIEQAASKSGARFSPTLSPVGVWEQSSATAVLSNSRWAKFLPPSSPD